MFVSLQECLVETLDTTRSRVSPISVTKPDEEVNVISRNASNCPCLPVSKNRSLVYSTTGWSESYLERERPS